MIKMDDETRDFLEDAKILMKKEIKNVSYLLKEIGNRNNTIAKVTGANVFAVGSEMLAFQIVNNLDRSYLLISLIGLRTLLENYINVHYIYHHPNHLEDEEWAEKLCKDYIQRTVEPNSRKNQLGEKSLYQRARIIGWEDLYNHVYSYLCKYSHFLSDILDSSVMPFYLKGKTIETAIYTITFYQDILIAISSFYKTSFDNFIDEIFSFKNKGETILSNINVRKEYEIFKENIKKFIDNYE